MRGLKQIGAASVAMLAAMTSGIVATSGALAQTFELNELDDGYLTLPVTIGEAGPYSFVFDTGASHTAIALPVAEELGFISEWNETDRVRSLTQVFQAERFTLQEFSVAGEPAQDINAVVIPVAPQTTHTIAGLLGADALAPDGYTLNFPERRLDLDNHRVRFEDGVYDQDLNLLFGAARITGQRTYVLVLIDSGAPYTIVNDAFRERRTIGVELQWGVGGVGHEEETAVSALPLRRVQIGGVCWATAYAFKADLDIFESLGWQDVPAMVMGMDLLNAGVLTVDREAGTFDFSPAFPEADCEHQRRVRYSDAIRRPS